MSLSDIILVVLCQSEELAWPSVVLPLHANFFCFMLLLDKTGDYLVSMKLMILDDLKNKPQAPGVSYTAFLCAFK